MTKVIYLESVMKTVIVSTPAELESGLKTLHTSINLANEGGAKHVVGLGYFHMEDKLSTFPDGLKLATATFSLWINLRSPWLIKSTSYEALVIFLQRPEITFLGLGIDEFSLDALYTSYGLKFWNVVDLASLAADVKGDKRLKSCGLLDLAWSVCRLRVKPSLLDGYFNSVVFVRVTPDSYADFKEKGQVMTISSVMVDAYLAFLIGNRLLGGEIPYKLRWEATGFLGTIASFIESLCSPKSP